MHERRGQLARQTVSAMQRRLQSAHQRDDVLRVLRIQALLDYLVNEVLTAKLTPDSKEAPK